MNGPPDLAALPAFGPPQPFNEIDIALASAYIGLVIVEVEPFGLLGPEATGWLGAAAQDRFRQAGDGPEPGELVAGQNAAREARMRAAGMPEEHIAMMRQMIQETAAEERARGWTVTFADGRLASVGIHRLGESGFDSCRQEVHAGPGRSGAEEDEDLLSDRARDVRDAPYETYDKAGVAVARGRRHDVSVDARQLSKETRAALAAVALRSLEG